MMANGNILCAGYLELVFTPGHRPAQVEPSHYNNFDDISSPLLPSLLHHGLIVLFSIYYIQYTVARS